MDIKNIKQIVNSNLPTDYQEQAILSIIADDKTVIPYIIEILVNKRNQNKELLLDTNIKLSGNSPNVDYTHQIAIAKLIEQNMEHERKELLKMCENKDEK